MLRWFLNVAKARKLWPQEAYPNLRGHWRWTGHWRRRNRCLCCMVNAPPPRPIPARDWPRLEVEGAGLQAELRTDGNHSVRYQLVVTPRSNNLKPAFGDAVRSHSDSISFTVHLYDKAGFELCKKDVKPVPVVGTGGRIDGLRANDAFYSLECSHSNYKEADHWSLTYVFPALTTGTPTGRYCDSRSEMVQKTRPGREVI